MKMLIKFLLSLKLFQIVTTKSKEVIDWSLYVENSSEVIAHFSNDDKMRPRNIYVPADAFLNITQVS